jgi:hypothetical protein
MPAVTDAQVRKLMEELSKGSALGRAAMKAGMDRTTARKYRDGGTLPSQVKTRRTWRTREDPFDAVWDEIVGMLSNAPELEAKTIFDHLVMAAEAEPTRPTFGDGQLRTLQRRVRRWRAQEAPAGSKEVFFAQEHRPGEALQTDFTHCKELAVTICGEAFEHMLCHSCLPYSNWQSVSVCHSESMLALRAGIQKALFRLGRVPQWSQTDNSTAATHRIGEGVDRMFNDRYIELVEHFGMKPRTIGVGESEQNGDIEAANGALKRRMNQYLLLRGSRDFESVAEYARWLDQVIAKANERRSERIAVDLAAMRPLVVSRLSEYDELRVPVSSGSTIRVLHNTYSVPSRLIGETLKVRVYEDRIEGWYAERLELQTERVRGRHGHRIDYRHIIWWLVRKPGAFAAYRYREELFPSQVFRRAYDRLSQGRAGRGADLEYLQLLYLAATTLEADVELALELLLEGGERLDLDQVKALIANGPGEAPAVEIGEADIAGYDELLHQGVAR